MGNTEEKRAPKYVQISLVCSGLVILNGVFSAYVVNYKPKVGEYHIWLCSALGVLLLLFTVWAVAVCVKLLKDGGVGRGLTVTVMTLAILMGIMWTYTAIPYYRDIIGGSTTVTTDSFLVVFDELYFLDNNGDKVNLTIPGDTADELWAKENYEYDHENNLLKYYDKMTAVYFPESGVIISVSAEG